MYKSLIFTFCFLFSFASYSQTNDTMIVYDYLSKTMSLIPPVAYDTNVTFDHTSSYVGTLGNQIPLSLTPPTTNLFRGSNFSDIARAELFFNVTDYPVRTAVILGYYHNDTVNPGGCSGIFIGENLVLTAGHCICYQQHFTGDSLLVAPAYDNGHYQTTLPVGIVEKSYIFKKTYDNLNIDYDLAILKLREPIGQQIGWFGIAFSSDTNYYSNKVFHKLSYPGGYNIDSTMYYNCDTLYYNYGLIKANSNSLFINSPMAWGIHGQSGSSLFYTDNFEYFSFGVYSLAFNYKHCKISVNTFYQLKNIMDNYTGIKNIEKNNVSYNLYPNPFSDNATLQFDNFKNENYNLEVYNNLGQLVKTISDINSGKVKIERDCLNSGIYLFQLKSEKQIVSAGKFIIH